MKMPVLEAAAILVGFLERIGAVPAFVIGLSEGANAAWELRDRFAGKARGMVLIGSAPWKSAPGGISIPTLFLHGVEDRVFGYEELCRFAALHRGDPIEVRGLPGMGHSFPYRILKREAWPWIQARLAFRSPK